MIVNLNYDLGNIRKCGSMTFINSHCDDQLSRFKHTHRHTMMIVRAAEREIIIR